MLQLCPSVQQSVILSHRTGNCCRLAWLRRLGLARMQGWMYHGLGGVTLTFGLLLIAKCCH